MAHPGFRHLWKQPEMSDVDIMISCDVDAAPAGDEGPDAQNSTLLQQFPGHSTILSSSPYFNAQALRWSSPSQPLGGIQARRASPEAGSKRQAKQQVNITLPHASYEPAAMAVLAGLYLVAPWHNVLADLTPQQQVQAAVLADMWELTAASEAAVGVLQTAADSDDSGDLAAAVLQQLLSLAALPDCLLPVFERVLLSKYGNLEVVWGPDSAALQESLLALPLHAMELLLASDKLKVASEDTVLYTARAYTNHLALSSRQQARDKLAPLVRCPHLSQFWLSASVLSDDAAKLLLQGLQPQLKRLLLLIVNNSTEAASTVAERTKGIPDVPASWLLLVRDITPVNSVSIQWELDVATIRQAAKDSASRQKTVILTSTTSCLLGGIKWGIKLKCYASTEGTTVGLFTQAKALPAGSSCRCTYAVECDGMAGVGIPITSALFVAKSKGGARGMLDFFGLGAMAGGFEEAAWAAKGLPAIGSIVLRLTVRDVGV